MTYLEAQTAIWVHVDKNRANDLVDFLSMENIQRRACQMAKGGRTMVYTIRDEYHFPLIIDEPGYWLQWDGERDRWKVGFSEARNAMMFKLTWGGK